MFPDGNVTVSMSLNVKRVDVAVVDSESLVHHETKPYLDQRNIRDFEIERVSRLFKLTTTQDTC